jgi:hypothetical protein
MTVDRKPLTKMESRDPKSIRFTPTEWDAVSGAARRRGFEPAVFARMLTMYGLSIAEAPTLAEAAAWVPALGREMLTGSQRIRRF